MRTITIEITDGQGFTVREGDRYQDQLAWDEMLGSIAELTHPKIGTCRYDLLTAEEWKARAEAREKRMAAINAGNQGKPSTPPPHDFDFVEFPRPPTDTTST